MRLRSVALASGVLFALIGCGVWVQQQQQQHGWTHQSAAAAAAVRQKQAPTQPAAAAAAAAAAGGGSSAGYLNLLCNPFRAAARALLATNHQQQQQQQRPLNATSAAGAPQSSRGDPDSRTLPTDSATIAPTLNPAILNVSRPRPAPAPAPTSAAAGEAALPVPYTGPHIKPVAAVKAGDSCVCWSPELCTCGWQACPYKPPDRAAALGSDAAQALFGSDLLPQLQLSGDAPAPREAPFLSPSMLRRFNKRISTQLINPLYQFTTEHYVLEGAKEVVNAGGDSYKFHLANLDARGNPISNVRTPLDMVRSPSLPYAEVFDQQLSMFFFWVFPDYNKPYPETYELAAYLLQKYQGTGKQFFIGMWEGDHALRKPGNWGHHVPPDVGRMETLQQVIQEKQRAVDNAKKDFGADCKNVYVWNYIEANFVVNSIWDRSKISIVNWMLPTIDAPPVDYVSYSAYEVLFSGDWKLTNLTAAFDYMAQRLPDKPGVPGPRVFLGEWAYPMYDPQGRPAWNLEESREKGLYAAAVSIAWGSQFNQYWQLYSNHRLANGTGDRGFWLVLPNRQETPIWTSMKDYFAASDIFLQRFWACYGGWPSDYTYRVWAVKTLMKLVNNGTKPEPAVRDVGSTSYSRQAHVVADNTFGEMGPTITFKVTGSTPADAASSGISYIPIVGAVQLPGDSSSSSSRQFTPPMVPKFLSPGGGDRGKCPVALPMIAAGVPRPPASPVPGNATGGNRTAAPGNATRPANATAGAPAANTTAGGNRTAGNSSSTGGQPALLTGFNRGPGGVQQELGARRSAGGKSERCEAWSKVPDRLQLRNEECPIDYPRVSLEDVASGKSKAYAYGGIDRIGCANCQQKGLWPNFCLWRRTEQPLWDSISCNQRESSGRSSVQRNLELAVNLTRYWPQSTGIYVPPRFTQQQQQQQQRLPPGPAEITPCDVYRLIRGRTLWIIGDSQMKGLYTALKCFMLEFWDLQQYAPTWNKTTLDYFNRLPRNSEARCIHLAESTRICQLKVLWADTFAERPSQSETRWTTPVWPLLQQHLAAPDDIFVLNFGLWYDPRNPTRYFNNLQSVGKAYQEARATFPNWFFVETVKLHWPDPPGDQDGPRTVQEAGGMETCTPTENVLFDPRTSQLKRVTHIDAAALSTAAGQLLNLGVIPAYYTEFDPSSSSSSSSSSSGRHRRRLLGITLPSIGSSSSSSSGSSSRQGGSGGGLLSWLHAARRLLAAAPFGRSLLQQQQPGSSGSSSSSSGAGGSDATEFPRLQPMFAANATNNRGATAAASNATSSGGGVRSSPAPSSGSGSGGGGGSSKPSAAASFNPGGPAGTPLPSPSPSPAAAAAAGKPFSPPAAAGKPSSPPAAAAAANRPVLAPGFGSVMLPPELATDAVISGLWRNQIARTVLRDRFGMAWVPIYNATVPAYWGHRHSPQAPDCIHYCNPGAPQNWMAKLMLAIAVNSKPLTGEVADKRCLWGTEVVREEGEA